MVDGKLCGIFSVINPDDITKGEVTFSGGPCFEMGPQTHTGLQPAETFGKETGQ